MRETFTAGRIHQVEVEARTDAYVRSRVTYDAGDLTVSGVMLRPNGAGPFPGIVLNHGYIEPSSYSLHPRPLRRVMTLEQKGGMTWRQNADGPPPPCLWQAGQMGILNRKKMADDPSEAIRSLLYGDVPLGVWRHDSADAISKRFRAASHACAQGRLLEAIEVLRALANDDAIESRDRLQAWAGLRELGVRPDPDRIGLPLGVVLDVPVVGGLDTLAAYADGSARYVNFSGRIAVVEPGQAAFRALIGDLVAEGHRLAAAIGPWSETPLGDLRGGQVTSGRRPAAPG